MKNAKINKSAEMPNMKSEDEMKKDKRAKFLELGEKRVANAMKAIRLVGNLSDKNNYIYSDEEAAQIIRALRSELAKTESRFKNSNKAEVHSIFKFS